MNWFLIGFFSAAVGGCMALAVWFIFLHAGAKLLAQKLGRADKLIGQLNDELKDVKKLHDRGAFLLEGTEYYLSECKNHSQQTKTLLEEVKAWRSNLHSDQTLSKMSVPKSSSM